MTALQLRAELKKEIDHLDVERLKSAADYLGYLAQPTLVERVAKAEKDVAAGRLVNWRKVRKNV